MSALGPNWTRVLLCAGLICLAVAGSPARGETTVNVAMAPESGATIRFGLPWTQTPRFGFAPVRVSIENSVNRERTWHFDFEGGMRNLFPGVLLSEESISVPALQTREVWIYVPIAEPGMNMTAAGGGRITAGPGMPPAEVKIVDTPHGKKVTSTRKLSTLSTVVVEQDIDTTTGTIVTTTTTPTSTSTRSRSVALTPGSTVTFSIDPATGEVSTRSSRDSRSVAPPITTIVVQPRSTTPVGGGGGGGFVARGATLASSMTLMVEVSGPGMATGRMAFPGTSSSNGMRPFAVSSSLEVELRGKLSALMRGSPNLSVLDAAQLPADWRVWSSFSGVILTSEEYAGLDAARRSALRAWVALGGQLCLSPTSKTGGAEVDPSTAAATAVGAGVIVTFPVPLAGLSPLEFTAETESPPPTPSTEKLARVREEMAARRAARERSGLLISGGSPPADTGAMVPAVGTWLREIKFFAGTAGLPDRSALTLEAGPLFETAKDEVTRNAWLAVFLVCFAVVVGPLNLFLFAPAQKRHRLFVTTPLIAVGASLLLGVTILVQDGTGGTGARRAVVMLLPGENQAAVVQEQAIRTGFLTGRSFALPDDVAMTVLPLEATYPYGGPNIELVRRNQRASGDWFQSRARQAQQLRRLVPTRARIERVGTAADGAPIVQSSLGTTLHEFSLIDAEGKGWRATELPSGQRVKLEATNLRRLYEAEGFGGTANLNAIVGAVTNATLAHWSGTGGATDLAPIPTLSSIRWKNANVLYVGAIETNPSLASAATVNAAQGVAR
jgi:hypothetical protein